MNGDPQIEALAGTYTPPPFPTWPPPSGGAPNTNWELGPITNPYPYGTAQGANISTNPPAPAHPWPSTFYPQKMPVGANGQNQGAEFPGLPAWPTTKDCILPDKAPPSLSQIP